MNAVVDRQDEGQEQVPEGRENLSVSDAEVEVDVAAGIRPLQWTTMLAAVATTPPMHLKKLDSLISGGAVVSAGGSTQRGESTGHPTSSMQGATCHRPLGWDDFAGYEDVKTVLKRLLRVARMACSSSARAGAPQASPAVPAAQAFQLSSDMARGIVLHGPTGCGKTFLAKVIAAEANMNFVPVRSTDLLSPFFGQTEAAIRKLFNQARAAAPCLLFFDEFDSLAYKR
jgi:hypothetical protein